MPFVRFCEKVLVDSLHERSPALVVLDVDARDADACR